MVNAITDELKQRFLSENFDIRQQALKKLARIHDDTIVDFFISHLKSADRRIQMSSASGLRLIANNRAIQPLLEAINNPNNKRYTGSFVYALQTHNCQDLLIPILEIALSNNYENQTHALEILSRQKFKTSKTEIDKAQAMLSNYISSENKCDDYGLLVKEISTCLDKITRRLKIRTKLLRS